MAKISSLKDRRAWQFTCGSALLLNLVSIAGVQSDTKFEILPTIHAQDLAPATLLSGSGFHVDDEVPTVPGESRPIDYRG